MAAAKKQQTKPTLKARAREMIAKELDALYKQRGTLEPVDVVRWAKAHPDSALHARFQWDDSAAAHQYRLYQARMVIVEVQVIYPDNKPRQAYVSLVDSRGTGKGGYAPLTEVLSDKQRRTRLLAQALAEYQRVGEKYADLKELADVRSAVAAVKAQHTRPVRRRQGGSTQRRRAA